jgi:hypothetical protein
MNVSLLADERLVGRHDLVGATQRRQGTVAHRLADAVRHEPRGLVRHAQRPHELVAADPPLAAAQQVRGLQPLVQRDVAGLEHRADRDGELALAGPAAAQALSAALHHRDPVLAAATRAHRTMRPQDRFQLRECGGLVVEIGC